MLAKQAWRMISNPSSLLGKTILAKYRSHMRSPVDGYEFKFTNCSWGWKGILWGLDLVQSNIAWKVGINSEIEIWNSKWVDGEVPVSRLSPGEEVFKTIFGKVKDLQKQGGCWNKEIIERLFDETWSAKILAIPLPTSQRPDKFFWNLTDTGNYTVKSGYGWAFLKQFEQQATVKDQTRVLPCCEEFIRCRLWRLPGPHKWRIFLWKIMVDCLPIGQELLKRKVSGHITCLLCGDEDCTESLNHLFRDCPFARRIWMGSDLGIRSELGRDVNIKTWIINWLNLLRQHDASSNSSLSFMATLWTIWRTRNDAMFRGTTCDFKTTMKFLEETRGGASEGFKRSQIGPSFPRVRTDTERVRDGAPLAIIGNLGDCQYHTIMVDAAWSPDKKGGLGWVVRSYDGDITNRVRRRAFVECPLQAEAVGVKEALSWARAAGLLHLRIMTDCLTLVLQLVDLQEPSHYIHSTLLDIMDLASYFHCVCVNFIPRKLNRIAHKLAQEAKQL